jgi:hypothetical protein
MANTGTIVYGSDYNAVQVKVRQVLGDGYPYGPLMYGTNRNYGWGQTLQSSLVNPSDAVTQAQFNALITDINTATVHIQNTPINVALHTPISYDDLTILNTDANTLLSSINSVGSGQWTIDAVASSVTVGAAWGAGNTYVTSYAHVYFNSSAHMQYFFNSGGEIRFAGLGPGTGTVQDTNWNTLLPGSFTPVIDLAAFSSMSTSTLNQMATYTAAGAYTANVATLHGMRFANFLVFRIRFTDGHVGSGGGPDGVSGGAGYNIRWRRATGIFNFTPTPSVYAGQFAIGATAVQGGYTGANPGPIPTFNPATGEFIHSVTNNIQNYNLADMLIPYGGNPAVGVKTITVQSGVYIWSDQVSLPAMSFVGITGGTIALINTGYIMGKGGNGGAALPDNLGSTLVGGAGGPAIKLSATLSSTVIDSRSGFIAGGGGGGGAAGYGTINSGDYHWGGGGGGSGGGRGGAGYSSAQYLSSAITISPAGTSTNVSWALVLPGASGQNGGTGSDAPAGGGGGRIILDIAHKAGPSGTTLTSGYGGSGGGSGGIWGGPLRNLTATGGQGSVVISGPNTILAGSSGSSTSGSPGSLATGGGGSWGAAGGAGSYNGAVASAGGLGGKAVDKNGNPNNTPSWFLGATPSKQVFGDVS